MHYYRFIILTACSVLLLLPAISHAQQSKFGNWFGYYGNNSIAKKWNWWNEVQHRNYNFATDLEQLLLRTGFGYNLTDNNNNVLLGYGFIHGKVYTADTLPKLTVNEHRIFQQYIYKHNITRIFIQHRMRVEERFISAAANSFRVRFRYLLGITIPINKKTMEKYAVYASGYNEIFLHANSPVFDRNRAYGGLGFMITKDLRVETGIMYQLLEKTKRPQWQIMLFNTIPFVKKQAG